MIKISVTDETAVFEVQNWDTLWALSSRQGNPLAHIREVRADPEAARGWWHDIKAAGTNVPEVITAGRFHQHGKRGFWADAGLALQLTRKFRVEPSETEKKQP